MATTKNQRQRFVDVIIFPPTKMPIIAEFGEICHMYTPDLTSELREMAQPIYDFFLLYSADQILASGFYNPASV